MERRAGHCSSELCQQCNATVHNQFRHQQAPSFQTVGENIYMNTGTLYDWIYLNFVYNIYF